jgi:hypothetical protein
MKLKEEEMKQDKDRRRSFLKHIVAGAAVAAGSLAAIRPVKATPVFRRKESDDVLYHESESFKKYYESLK